MLQPWPDTEKETNMNNKLTKIATMGLLGVTLAAGSVAASAHERIGFGVNIGVPVVGYAGPGYGYGYARGYAPPAPYYYESPPYYTPVVAGYYGPRYPVYHHRWHEYRRW
jgi:hypothetical protein